MRKPRKEEISKSTKLVAAVSVRGASAAELKLATVGALLRAIETLQVDPARRATLGAAGRQRAVDEFDVPTMVAGYTRVYDRACRLAGRRRWRRARFA